MFTGEFKAGTHCAGSLLSHAWPMGRKQREGDGEGEQREQSEQREHRESEVRLNGACWNKARLAQSGKAHCQAERFFRRDRCGGPRLSPFETPV